MCGIAGIHRRNGVKAPQLERFAMQLLQGLELRGRDASGYITLEDSGHAVIRKNTIPAHAFVKLMKQKPNSWGIESPDEVRTLMAHTRFATVGRRDDVRNAHPHASGTIAAVHNGTIWNADELFDAFKLKRRATVDSEVVPALINEFGWEHVRDALELLEGGAALSLVCATRPRELILARVRDFPLFYVMTDEYVVWASSPQVIRQAWDAVMDTHLDDVAQIYYLQDGQMIHVLEGESHVSSFTPMQPTWKRWESKTPSTSTTTWKKNQAPTPGSKNSTKKARKKALKLRDREVQRLMKTGINRKDAEWILDTDEAAKKEADALVAKKAAEIQSDELKRKEIQLEKAATQAASDYAASRFTDEGRTEEIAWLMQDGFTRDQASAIVDEGLEALFDVIEEQRLEIEDVSLSNIEDYDFAQESFEGHVENRMRNARGGRVEHKSPATKAMEALGP